jgi:hypothetical protein
MRLLILVEQPTEPVAPSDCVRQRGHPLPKLANHPRLLDNQGGQLIIRRTRPSSAWTS